MWQLSRQHGKIILLVVPLYDVSMSQRSQANHIRFHLG